MKNIKKIIALILLTLMALTCFAGCGQKADSDLAYVKEKGELVVGITDFAPMDYKEEGSDEWIGFDADMAKLFAEKLGVKVKFVEIDWDNKAIELANKSIDVVWNGMTISDEVKAAMDVSNAYCNNAQMVIVKADVADNYKTAEDCKNLKFAVEAGSAGKDQAVANGFEKITEVDVQSKALVEVAAGTSDAAIIDSLMAGAMIGEGTSYANLKGTVKLNSEEYGVGFRKGSNLVAELNAFFDECKANGKMEEIAKKYGVQEALIK